jgi:hypothetical protein
VIVTLRTRVTWVVTAAVGLAAGATASSYIVAAVGRPLSPLFGGLVYVALYGAVIGCIAGIVQLGVMPRGAVRWSLWIGANVVGFGAGYVLASIVAEALGNAIDPAVNLVLGEGTIEVTAGAVLGLAVGVAQSRAMRNVLPSRAWWVVATAVGVGLGYGAAAAVLGLFDVTLLKANFVPAFGAIAGLFVGLAQAIALRSSDRDRPRSSPQGAA